MSNPATIQILAFQLLGSCPYLENDKAVTSTIGLVQGIGPRDTLEGLLAAQMVATHTASMEMLRRSLLPEQTVEGANYNVNRAVKLMRTFTAQVQTLNRYRGKTSQQKVTVEHVHVNAVGQAIVGAVSSVKGKS